MFSPSTKLFIMKHYHITDSDLSVIDRTDHVWHFSFYVYPGPAPI